MAAKILFLVIFGTVAIAAPAFAEDGSRSFFRQLLVMWLPLIVIIGVWIYFIRKMGPTTRTQREAIERSIPHMEALERKLDRIIELLERQVSR